MKGRVDRQLLRRHTGWRPVSMSLCRVEDGLMRANVRRPVTCTARSFHVYDMCTIERHFLDCLQDNASTPTVTHARGDRRLLKGRTGWRPARLHTPSHDGDRMRANVRGLRVLLCPRQGQFAYWAWFLAPCTGQRADADSHPRDRRPAIVEGTNRMTSSQSDDTVSRGISDERESKTVFERVKTKMYAVVLEWMIVRLIEIIMFRCATWRVKGQSNRTEGWNGGWR